MDVTYQADYADIGLEQLRSGAVRAIAMLLVLAATCVALLVAANPDRWQFEPVPVVAGLLTTAALTHWTLRYGVTGPTLLLILGSGLSCAAAVEAFSSGTLAAAFLLVTFMSAMLLGWRGAAITWAATSGLVLAMSSRSPEILSSDLALEVVFLNTLAAALGWLVMRPTHSALEWAWSSYKQAFDKTEEARDHRAQLAQLTKSLAEAYSRLESANEELERARKAAVEARRMKAEFAATLSHELRTPLNLIVGFSELLVLGPHTRTPHPSEDLWEDYVRDVEIVYRNACLLASLVDDVLDLSQVEAHRLALQKDRVALCSVVEEAVAAVDGMYRGLGLTVASTVPTDIPEVEVDRVRIRQVVVNLLSNAARYTVRGGVRIEAEVHEHDVVVSVADTGLGIPEEDLETIFDEFTQLPDSDRRHHSGLGLAICKRFVELHGGSIWVESVPGKGSTFFFTIPLNESVVGAAVDEWERPGWAAPRASTKPAVAVLGDDPDVVRVFRGYLDEYEVVAGDRASLSADVDRLQSVGAVIVSGSGQCSPSPEQETMAPELARLPVISCPLRTRRRIAEDLGVVAYLNKPVTHDRLASALAELRAVVKDVLIVDDDPEMLVLLSRMVRRVWPSVAVTRAEGGAECLELLSELRPDLVLLDLLMPEVSGYDVLRELRTRGDRGDVPVIVISAKGQDDNALIAESLSIRKPGGLVVHELMNHVRASLRVFLDSSELARER
jgi:signal transduction histidine kinase/CheY-like chemotaxis protein